MYTDPSLAGFDDSAFAAEVDRRVEVFKAAATADEATRLYRESVLPAEAERLRREAKDRTAKGEPLLDLLFVTVGAQADSPALAIIASPAQFVVLLHTEKEQTKAQDVVRELKLQADEATLRSIGDGTRILDLYQVCFAEWERRGRPKRVAFDLTGGLKTMSAAAAAAVAALERIRKRQGTEAFLKHLAGAGIPGLEATAWDKLGGRMRDLDLDAYMLATRETLRLTAWFRRAVQAEFE